MTKGAERRQCGGCLGVAKLSEQCHFSATALIIRHQGEFRRMTQGSESLWAQDVYAAPAWK